MLAVRTAVESEDPPRAYPNIEKENDPRVVEGIVTVKVESPTVKEGAARAEYAVSEPEEGLRV